MKQMKKVLALILVLTLALALWVPAMAAGGSDDMALQAVTLKVKNVLDLDTEDYLSFDGWSQDDVLLGRRWYLSWSGDGISLSITSDEAGKIYAYRYYETASDPVEPVYRGSSRFSIPSLPTGDAKACLAAANAFLAKVLDKDLETVELKDDNYPSLTRTTYRFSGTVKLHGTDSPITCSLTVRAKDALVTAFSRSDQSAGFLGELPTPDTKVSEAQARRSLRSQITMEPFYVLDTDGKDTPTAQVRYLATWGHDYYVDGKTGELVDLTKLREALRTGTYDVTNKYFAADAAEAAPEASLASGGAALNQVEIDGSAKLAGALDKEVLSKAVVNAWPELGLKNYTLVSASYSLEEIPQTEEEIKNDAPKSYDVNCRLSYQLRDGADVVTKYVSVNAKTGALLSVGGYRPFNKDTRLKVMRNAAQSAAEEFLKLYAPDDLALMELYDTYEASAENWSNRFTFTYCQKANGYFYTANRYVVSVDAMDGTICGLSKTFDHDVELIRPKKVVGAEAALTAYIEALDLRYGYVAVPAELRAAGPEVYARLKDTAYTYVNTLRPGYTIAQGERYVSGVMAETGEAVIQPEYDHDYTTITYDDVAGSWVAEAANALAAYNVGFPGGSLKGSAYLTQRDMLALFASIQGYRFDDLDNKQTADDLYSACYFLGLVTPETRNDTKYITRGELIRVLLDAAGYKKIAAIPGIFTCSYSDKASIPASDMGYAALAQGLGLVRGGSDGAYAAPRVATRAEAVALLYQYMK